MLLQKKSQMTQLKLSLEIEEADVARLEKVRADAAARGLKINLEAEVVRVIKGQISRAERALAEAAE